MCVRLLPFLKAHIGTHVKCDPGHLAINTSVESDQLAHLQSLSMVQDGAESLEMVRGEYTLEGFQREKQLASPQLDSRGTMARVEIFASVGIQVMSWRLVWDPLGKVTLHVFCIGSVRSLGSGDCLDTQPILRLGESENFIRNMERQISGQTSQISVRQDGHNQFCIRVHCQIRNVSKVASTYFIA